MTEHASANPVDSSTASITGAREKSAAPAQGSPHSLSNQLARAVWGIVYTLLFRTSPRPLHRWRNFLLRLFGAKLHRTARIYPRARIWAPWRLEMAERTCIADDVYVYNLGGLTMGANSTVSQFSHLCGAGHDFEYRSFPPIILPIKLGHSVWVATDVFVGAGVTIGDGTVVGARSSVFSDLPPWVVAVGSPAKVVKERVLRD